MAGLLEVNGARPQKEPKFAPLFIEKTFTGLYTQRSVLHDPSDIPTARFYGGRPDALWMGSNVELTNRLTLQRRPGLSPFSTATYPTSPNTAFSFQLINGTIQVIVDTSSTGNLVLTGVATSVAGTAVYSGIITGGAADALVGMSFQVTGFLTTANNGTFICTASTATTLTLANANAVLESDPATAISSGAVYIDNQNGTKTLLFPKSPGAGQTYFSAVAGILYFGNGIDTKKYTPLNTNGLIWNWGIVAPAVQPSVVITESGSAATTWQMATWFSTMGIVIESDNLTGDPVAHQLTGLVNNPTPQFGMSGSGGPNWNQTVGGTTSDGTITWTNLTEIGSWQPNTVYSGISQSGGATTGTVSMIYDPNSGGFYANSYSTAKTSGATRPNFNGVVNGGPNFDGTDGSSCNWVCYANVNQTPGNVSIYVLPNAFVWESDTVYGGGYGYTGSNNGIVEPNPLPLILPNALPTPTYYQHSGGGTSHNGTYTPWTGSTPTAGQIIADGELQWTTLNPPSATWVADTNYFAWTASNNHNFSCVVDDNGCLEVCTATGLSQGTKPWNVWQANHAYAVPVTITDTNGNVQIVKTAGTSWATAPAWNTTINGTTTDNSVTWINHGPAYGVTTNDGIVVWTNCGLAAGAVWTTSQSFNLPTGGFSPPSPSDPYGGSDVLDNNSPADVEFVINTGVSGSVQPTWAMTSGYTTDNTITWYNNGPQATHSLTWQTGYNYAYSFKARSLTDYYSVDVTGTNSPPVPPGLSVPLPPPTGSETGAISTASPAFTITGGNAGAVNTISGYGSTDPQVDTIVIWRSADGGSPAQMYELTEIPSPPPGLNGAPQPWSFQDYLPDTPTSVYPGLNELIPAPINHSNDPPVSTFLPMVYNFQRIWGANGQSVPFSGGPDVVTGNPNEAFNPSDELPFLANVIRIVKNSQGLVTFLTDSIEFIAGGPATSSFFSVTVGPGIGLASYNALDIFAGEIYFFAADNELRIMSPTLNITSSGFPIGDQLANLPSSGVSDTTWNSSTAYLAVYQNGIDNCIILADGSTGWYRMNPKQVPGGPSGVEPIWSPFAHITNGCKMVQTVEISPGQKRLLVGGTGVNQEILERDLTVYTDNGIQYGAYFVMGAIQLAHPGQLAVLKFLEFDFSGQSYQPMISYLLDELSGTFTPFTSAPQFDPPSLYGTTLKPKSFSPNRYYFSNTASLARCKFIQLKVDFGTTPNPDEVMDLCIYGRILVET